MSKYNFTGIRKDRKFNNVQTVNQNTSGTSTMNNIVLQVGEVINNTEVGANITVSLDVRTTFVTTTVTGLTLSIPDATTIGFTKVIVPTDTNSNPIELSFRFNNIPDTTTFSLSEGFPIFLMWTGTRGWAVSLVD